MRYADLDESRVCPDLFAAMRAAAVAGQWPVYLFGSTGLGKSYAAAMAYVRCQACAMFVSAVDFTSTAIEADRTGEVSRTLDDGRVLELTKGQWWRWIESVDLLVIDDIGVGGSNQWREAVMQELLDRRHRKGLILTGNLSIEDIGSVFGERIRSRLLEGTPIRVIGEDKRVAGVRDRAKTVRV